MESLSLFATVPKGMSDLLATELRDFGATDLSETPAGVSFAGDLEVAYRACLWSRLANRILLALDNFKADSPETLYEGVQRIDWQQHLAVTGTLAVDANVSASAMTHSHYAALKVKDAVVDTFSQDGGVRPSVDVARPDLRINCYIHRDRASVYLDLSGASLHQRGYRLESGQAPLKENLAVAILLRARWPEVVGKGGALVDPMCGSGTLPLEAAMIAGDIAPGLMRDHFGFHGWKGHREDIWQRLVAEAHYRRDRGRASIPTILGFDNDRRVLSLARQNAARLGLEDTVAFARQDLFEFRHDFPQIGLVVTNPPYGKRLAAAGELPALYRALGSVLRENFVGWRAAVITEDQELGKHIGIRAARFNTLYNGAMACKLIHFDIEKTAFFRDDRLPRSIDDETLSEQAQMFANRLQKNLKQQRRWANREGIDCYRVYDADLPDYSAAIDLYRQPESAEQWVCIQEYEAPASVDPAKARTRTREIRTMTQRVFDVADDHLFYKSRARQRGDSQYERLDDKQHFVEVREGQCRLLVNFDDYLDTGLFLDHRPLRLRLASEARGKRFLNLFAYTGAATVHAASGGAIRTTTVDMSATYLDWAKRNMALNDLVGEEHQFVQADCVAWLDKGGDKMQYDLILLDPPTFSNSKKMKQPFDVQKDHPAVIANAMRLLQPGGTLYFSTNLRAFKLSDQISANYEIRDITEETIPPDFKRRKNIHHCWMIRHPARN